jgi:hypothetical protein
MDSSLRVVCKGEKEEIRGMSFDTRCIKTGTRVMICTHVDSKLVRRDKLRYVKRTSQPQNEQNFRANIGIARKSGLYTPV